VLSRAAATSAFRRPLRPVEATFQGDNELPEPSKGVPRWRIGVPVLRGKPLTTAYPVETGRPRFSSGVRRDAERLYAAAVRHSRLVRVLRIGVPAVLAGAVLLTVGANYMPTIGPLRLPGEIGKLVIKGTKVTMQAPRLTGYTGDSRPYEFTASSADQDITKPDLMELHQIQAKIELEDKRMVNLTGNSG